MEHYSNFCTFEIASLPNVPGLYLRKYGKYSRTNVNVINFQDIQDGKNIDVR